MKKIIALALTVMALVAFSAQGFAACSAQEVQDKAQSLQQLLVEMSQKNPQKVMEVSQEMQTKAAAIQGNDTDALCKFYDEMIAKLK